MLPSSKFNNTISQKNSKLNFISTKTRDININGLKSNDSVFQEPFRKNGPCNMFNPFSKISRSDKSTSVIPTPSLHSPFDRPGGVPVHMIAVLDPDSNLFMKVAQNSYKQHMAELIACGRCGRKFFPDRISRHESNCSADPIKLNTAEQNNSKKIVSINPKQQKSLSSNRLNYKAQLYVGLSKFQAQHSSLSKKSASNCSSKGLRTCKKEPDN